MSVWVWKIGKSHRELGLQNRVIAASQRFCISPRTVGGVTRCVPVRCPGAKSTSCLSEVQVIFPGSPHVNCVNLVDSILYWWYGVMVGFRDKQCVLFRSLLLRKLLLGRLSLRFNVVAIYPLFGTSYDAFEQVGVVNNISQHLFSNCCVMLFFVKNSAVLEQI